ncbi:exodeoxyribonuclease VII small subunit [Candidatus Saccharibacteria bacterium]|nr:exodeoxyribonuclease VII small subunit [Candidatus Saccharibacteria bacterium]
MEATMKTSKQPSAFNYANALKELEDITTYLESSDVDLDKAITMFDRGSELAAEIEIHLKKAENKIKTIRSKTRQEP